MRDRLGGALEERLEEKAAAGPGVHGVNGQRLENITSRIMPSNPLPAKTGQPPELRDWTASLIERAPMPMLEVQGSAHLVTHANSAFCILLGKARIEVVGQSFDAMVAGADQCLPALNLIYQTGEAATHVQAGSPGSDGAHWLYAMWPTLDENSRPVGVIIQITKGADLRKNATAINEALLISGLQQQELAEGALKLNAQLEREIAERKVPEAALHQAMEELKAAHGALKRAGKAKDNFLAALSHELRTPLAPVLMAAASLREDERLPLDVREQLGMIERNVALEARLIDDLLDLTMISNGKLQLRAELCDAHHLIRCALDIVREDARAKDIIMEGDLAAHYSWFTADPARFQQVIWNLLRNAVKFTSAGGRVFVRTRDEKSAAGTSWLHLEVADSGRGIDSSRLEEIFQPFDQGGLTGGHRFGGVGLGLAIARAVVDMHGGRIRAQSGGLNLGATFVVEWPGAVEPLPIVVEDTAAPFLVASALTGKIPRGGVAQRLLLVDDHVSTLQALLILLEGDGHHVVTATSVREALAAAATHTFDLVISDVGLADGSGNDLMEKLRATYGLRGIALTGYGAKEDLVRSHDAGFFTHLVKPVSVPALRRAIASLARG